MSLATTFEDEPYEYPDGSPVNNATRSYNGTTTIRTAIQNSINVVAVKCLEKVTPELGLKYLDNFGFTTLAHGTEADKDANGNVWSDANLATALGGITRGVTNVELCASYAAIANGGNYIKPIYYTKILDHNGNVLIENTAAERSVIKESTAFLLTSAMEDVVKQGTGTACQLDNMPVAGKTGTTEAYNDLWFVGYTPYYTCAVWSGYDNNEKLPDYARNFHKALWKKVMTRIHEGLPSKEFEKPASVEKLSVCEETGLLPRAGCPVITEYFDVGTMPTEYCDQHFYDSDDDYDYNYDTDSSDQTDNTTDTDNSENPDNGDTDNSGDSNNTDDNGNSATTSKLQVIVDNTAPYIELAQIPAGDKTFGEGAKSKLRIKQSGSLENLWSAKITDADGKTVRSFSFESRLQLTGTELIILVLLLPMESTIMRFLLPMLQVTCLTRLSLQT